MKPLAPKDIKSQAVDEKKHPSELKPALNVAQPVRTKSGTVTPKAKAKSGSPGAQFKHGPLGACTYEAQTQRSIESEKLHSTISMYIIV
jgi:hypothetical protein